MPIPGEDDYYFDAERTFMPEYWQGQQRNPEVRTNYVNTDWDSNFTDWRDAVNNGAFDLFVGNKAASDAYAMEQGQRSGSQVSGVQNGLAIADYDENGEPILVNPYLLDEVTVKGANLAPVKAARERRQPNSQNVEYSLMSPLMDRFTSPIRKVFDRAHSNMFPYDYTRNGKGEELSFIGKFVPAIFRKDPGRDFMDRLAAADLNDPAVVFSFLEEIDKMREENKQQGLVSEKGKGWLQGQTEYIGEEDPLAGLKYLQRMYRSRLDLLEMYMGRPQKYGMWMINPDYESPGGVKRYTFSHPGMRDAFSRDARLFLNWQNTNKFNFNNDNLKEAQMTLRNFHIPTHEIKAASTKNGNKLIRGVNGGPYEPAGDFSIVTDLDGGNAVWIDEWDYGIAPWIERLLNHHPVKTGDVIKDYADIPTWPNSYHYRENLYSSPSLIGVKYHIDNDDSRWSGR